MTALRPRRGGPAALAACALSLGASAGEAPGPAGAGPEQAPVCAVPAALLSAESLLAAGRFWHGSRAAPIPAGVRPLPAESLLAAALAAEGMGKQAEVEALLRRARGGDSLAAFVALAARADERASRWAAAEVRYRSLITHPGASEEMRAAATVRLAVTLERGGRRDSAAAAWRLAAVTLPVLADWFAVRRAELTDDTTVAFAIISGSRSPATTLRARLFVARRRSDAGDHAGAADVYRRFGRPLDIARAEFALGRRRDARARADSVLFAQTTRPEGMLAAQFLTERFDSLTVAELLAIARTYRFHRDPRAAERFVRQAIRSGRSSVEAWLALAELESERRNFGAALQAVDSAGARGGRAGATRIARARVAVMAAAGRWPEVDTLMRLLVQAHPGDTNIAQTLLMVAERDRIRQEPAAETGRYLALVRRFPDASATTTAHFRLALAAYARGERDAAAARFALAAARDTGRALWYGPRYWDARVRFERGDTAAVGELRRLAAQAPTLFYGARARELLGDSIMVEDRALPPPRPGSFPPATARERIRLLASLGLDAEARAEAIQWVSDTTASVQLLIAAAAAAAEAGYARESIALGEAARARVGMVPGVVRALFPYSYRPVIEAEAAEHCVDPLLMASIIRQESRFDPRAVSRVGARGIGQVMPGTGEELARRLRLGQFDADLLFVPDFNLHLGARYIRERTEREGLPVHAALAAYNAGPSRVARWRSWPEFDDPDLFAERIPISETRDYVRTVYASYLWYRQVYPSAAPAAATSPDSPQP